MAEPAPPIFVASGIRRTSYFFVNHGACTLGEQDRSNSLCGVSDDMLTFRYWEISQYFGPKLEFEGAATAHLRVAFQERQRE
jgi:hypothetical protein